MIFSKKTDPKSQGLENVQWRSSFLILSATLATILVTFAFVLSVTINIHSIRDLNGLVLDPKIEESLDQNIERIKEVYSLKQKLVIVGIAPYVEAWIKHGYASLSPVIINSWLQTLNPQLLPPVEEQNIEKISTSFDLRNGEPTTEWISKSKLRITNYLVEFKDLPEFISITAANEVRARYQFIGRALSEKIVPSILLANTLSMMLCFFLLMAGFLALGQRFQTHIRAIIEGFRTWSLGKTSFRFPKEGHGEFAIISSQFNEMADRLDEAQKKSFNLEKIASWQEIAKKMAHEVKNPLTPIKLLLTQVVRSYPGDDQAYRKLLDNAETIVNTEIKTLTNLVDNFSEFARLPEPQKIKTDLRSVVAHAVTMQRLSFPQHQISADDGGQAVEAFVDPVLLGQVINNLIKNAAESSDKGLAIRVRIEATRKMAKIIVQDNGPGIDEHLQKKVFEPHFSSKAKGTNGSMGLGLTICQKIILDHDGSISLESKPNSTSFTINLHRSLSQELELTQD